MKPSPTTDKKLVEQRPPNNKREPYQTPNIVYEGTISIRAGSPTGASLSDPGNPFGADN
jgi:hypothetical protein